MNNTPLNGMDDINSIIGDISSTTKEHVHRTVISKYGIKQNPTGWTEEGERVWGGGIVKYKKGEWIHWEIDLDDENNSFNAASLMGGAAPTVTPARVGTSAINAPAGVVVVVPRQTEFAFASNLSRVEQKPLAEGQGNVHSGATPPWMVDEQGATIPTVHNSVSLNERHQLINKNKKGKNSKKIGANINRDSIYSENWLPNFGRVFNEGPRSETRNEFKEEMSKKKLIQVLPSVATTNVKEKLMHRQSQQLLAQQQQNV